MILVLKVESTFLSETFEKKFNLLINSALSILTLLLLSNEQNIKPLIKHESFLSNRSKISLVLFILDLCTCVNYYASIKFKMVLEKKTTNLSVFYFLCFILVKSLHSLWTCLRLCTISCSWIRRNRYEFTASRSKCCGSIEICYGS
jgi:hypothetical protein